MSVRLHPGKYYLEVLLTPFHVVVVVTFVLLAVIGWMWWIARLYQMALVRSH